MFKQAESGPNGPPKTNLFKELILKTTNKLKEDALKKAQTNIVD